VILRERHRLKVLENRLLRRIFGPKRDEVTGEWRRLYALYFREHFFSMIKSGTMRLAEHAARMGDGRSAYRVLVGSPEGKLPFGRSRHKWEDNIKNGSSRNWIGAWNGLIWLRIRTGGGFL
jgi:hypothetical protein